MRRLLLSLVSLYKKFVSPLLGNNCRFHPTCSEYCSKSIERHGSWLGGYYSLLRLLRCGPWSKGGIDEVRE